MDESAREPIGPLPYVAVVAVHGVGTPDPGDTARTFTKTLLALADERHRYSFFEERPVVLPLRPLVVKTGLEDAGPADDPAPASRAGRIRRMLRGLLAFSVPRIVKTTGDVDEDVHGRVMRYLLAAYRRPVASGFTTIRLEGRLHLDGHPAAAIHTHELYWADLSKSSANPLATALEMLKLPLKILVLGQRALEYGSVQNRSLLWETYRMLVLWASALLTLFIPVLNAAVVGLLVARGALTLPRWLHLGLGASVLGVVLLVAIALWCARRGGRRGTLYGSLVLAGTLVVVGGAVLFAIPGVAALGRQHLLAAVALGVWWLVVASAAAYFNPFRPGLAITAHVVVGLVVLHAVSAIVRQPADVTRIAEALLASTNVPLAFLTLAWLLTFVFALLSLPASLLVLRSAAGARRVALRSMWVAGVAFAIALAFVELAQTMLFRLVQRHVVLPELRLPAVALADQVFSATAQWVPFLVTSYLTLTMVFLIWVLVPSLRYEVQPLEDGHQGSALGDWLSFGLRGLILFGFIGFVVTVPLPVVLGLFLTPTLDALGLVETFRTWSYVSAFNEHFWKVVAAGVVGIAGVGLRFRLVFGAIWPVIGILLDVAAYLQDLPRKRTPRAEMAERMGSLLNHLDAWRDPRGRGYDLIVFVAHSQGSVLVADILRFLRADLFRALDGAERTEFRVPLVLVTLGSPLRQIYAEAFPQSYDWVRGGGDAGRLLEDLGVREWLNVYRSGDYVGRALWEGGYDVAGAPAANPGEVCLGAGAHTRYFESPRVARIVDDVIARHLPATAPVPGPAVAASGIRVVGRPAGSPERP